MARSPRAGNFPFSVTFSIHFALDIMPLPSAQQAVDYSEGGEGDLADPLELEVPAGVAGERLDKILAMLMPTFSRGRIQDWIVRERVWVNRRTATVRLAVYAGDLLTVAPEAAPEQLAFRPEPVDFAVVFENPRVIVVDKHAGLVVHPGSGNWQGTLLNGLLHRYPELAGVPRAGIVHRLDKDTTGLMVVARSLEAQTALVRALQARTVQREYVCLAHGRVPALGMVDEPVGRDPRSPIRMAVVRGAGGKPAVTHWRTEAWGSLGAQPVSRVECRLESGRTHQIRVHMRHLGHPLLGDPLYGDPQRAAAGPRDLPARQMLHARRLAFADPADGAPLAFTTPPPADMLAVLNRVDWE
jgi:23S rRNA pseudouridine1911/1915/1917 synthase